MPTEKATKIANAFGKYAETGDKSLIKEFKREDIEAALLQYHQDKGWNHYVAMERRIEELKEDEKFRREKKEKWKDRLIGFIFGIISALIGAYLLGLFKLGKK